MYVIADNWNNPGKGVTYDKDDKQFKVDQIGYLFDPQVHPIDFFDNLVKFTFPGEYYYSTEKFIKKAGKIYEKMLPLNQFITEAIS